MVTELHMRFKVITPLFMGGADKIAELRPPAFKGLLRFWYRAADPNFAQPLDAKRMAGPCRESSFFGGSTGGAGQSAFHLQIDSPPAAPYRWDRERVRQFDSGKGKKTRNGLVYLGYPFHMGKRDTHGEERTAIPPGHEFTVRCILPRGEIPGLRKALITSWWLLAHLGGAGSRGRRGFGNLALMDWGTPPEKEKWPELDMLPLLHRSASLEEYAAELNRALQQIRSWFGGFTGSCGHPHLGGAMKVKFIDAHFPLSSWDAALNTMGRELQDFRAGSPPDRGDVRDHLLARKKKGGGYLRQVPSRATFGLPLTFRYGRDLGGVTVVPFDQTHNTALERHASLLHLRLAVAGNRLYPLFARLAGDVPGYSPPAALRGQGPRLRSPKENAMDKFMG